MGLCESIEETGADVISKQIDLDLMKKPKNVLQKLLILGPSESGKSTCVKQMQILHTNGFSIDDLERKKYIVFSNTVVSMAEIVAAMYDLGIQFSNPTSTADINAIKRHIDSGREYCSLPIIVSEAIKNLWRDPAVRVAYERRCDYHIQDSASYFFDNIDRIAAKDYRPTCRDVLLTRVATTGVVKLQFMFKSIEFNVYDVGGQRSERRKWIHVFDDVNAIIFVAAISEYDQRVREDNRTNRLMEAIELFHNVANSMYFAKSTMILFLNKKDLFEEKIKKLSLSILFLSYGGGLNYDEGITFLRSRFQNVYKNKSKLYIHETCATDTNQLDIVFNSVLKTIVSTNLKGMGVL
uniref:Uncharacterized protein n=1 Tax=Meloidogyne incognita TaxID=6306 RepID=A0A914KG30_MELIC